MEIPSTFSVCLFLGAYIYKLYIYICTRKIQYYEKQDLMKEGTMQVPS
jgi:hypothetical protein